MLKIHYCSECLKEIESYGEMISIFYEQVCDYFIETEGCLPITEFDCLAPIGFSSSLDSIIHFLEMKNFIISTDTDYGVLLIKPVGYVSDGFFSLCRNSGCHV